MNKVYCLFSKYYEYKRVLMNSYSYDKESALDMFKMLLGGILITTLNPDEIDTDAIKFEDILEKEIKIKDIGFVMYELDEDLAYELYPVIFTVKKFNKLIEKKNETV